MSNKNPHEANEALKVKTCPFLAKGCIKQDCSLFVLMNIKSLVGKAESGMCSLPALVLMISDINRKTQLPQQNSALRLPLIRG